VTEIGQAVNSRELTPAKMMCKNLTLQRIKQFSRELFYQSENLRIRAVRSAARRHVTLHSKVGNMALRKGDVIRLETSGGGGHGSPADRPAEDLARDRALGYVSG
jgi:N-methylhydantoinase B